MWHLDWGLSLEGQFTKENEKDQPALSRGNWQSSKNKKIEQNLLKTQQRGGGLGRSQSGSPCHHAALLSPHPPDSINSTLGRAKQASQSYFYAHTDQANNTRVALFGAAFLRPRFSLRRSLWLQGFYVASVFGSGTLQEGREMGEMEEEAPPI